MPGVIFGHCRSKDPSDSKSNRLHGDIFRSYFTHFIYILSIPLKLSVNFLKSLTSTGSSATNRQFFPDILGLNS